MLNKASKILNLNGIILYMVCSFIKSETEDQINNFLKEQSNFQLYKFDLIEQNIKYSKLLKNNFMLTLPNTIKKNSIDGYFASLFEKIKMILIIRKIILIHIIYKFKSYKNLSFLDLNFRKIDFTNYKQIKSFIFKRNFYTLKNINIHSFDFLELFRINSVEKLV